MKENFKATSIMQLCSPMYVKNKIAIDKSVARIECTHNSIGTRVCHQKKCYGKMSNSLAQWPQTMIKTKNSSWKSLSILLEPISKTPIR